LRDAAARHRILIGTAVEPSYLAEPEYAKILSDEFSMLEPENNLKFGQVHPRPDTDPNPYDFSGPDALVAFAQAHKMKMRGHTLVWHNQQPRWVTGGGLTPDQLNKALQSHIKTVVGRYAGKIFAWDVVNEAFNDDGSMRHTVWYDRPGIGFADQGAAYIEQALRWARATDRRAKLFVNDYGAETIGKKSDAIYAMAKDFRKRRVPLDGIGFQLHCDLSFDRPEALDSFKANLQRFADLGLDIHITEMDVRLRNNSPESLDQQAKLYGDVVKICGGQPRCKVIQIWGFTDKHSWLRNGHGLLWDENYQKKPAYDAFLRPLLGK